MATANNVRVRVSAQGDTLVGPSRIPIRTLRPGIVFAGTYAGNASWFLDDEAITFQERQYHKSDNELRLDCGEIVAVGEHMGIALFGTRDADRPLETIYVAVRPGIWQGYKTGLQRTRGED